MLEELTLIKDPSHATEQPDHSLALHALAERIQSRAYRLGAAHALEALLADAEPRAFSEWRKQRDHLIEAALLAPRRHVETLLPVMRQCGLAPGEQPPSPT